MSANGPGDDGRVDLRDYYEVLGAEPSASVAELRAAFREAVLRHHPDRSAEDSLATRRTSVLNRAWSELRDPVRRLHYDHALERGSAATLAWPLGSDEAPSPSRRGRRAARPLRTPWHTPEFRSVQGFRVPTQVFMAGPAAQKAWIVANHIQGQDWREHRERYWLRFAAAWYRDRGRTDDWLGALERLVELDGTFETLVRADLRSAYVTAREYLRGLGFLRTVAMDYGPGTAQR
jgi:curved DNA-binding protein CbpA